MHAWYNIIPKTDVYTESRDIFKSWEISDDISLTVQDRQLKWKTNGKSYVAYRVVPMPMPLNDLENHFCCLKLF